jgi:hypothetical protein
MKLGSEDTARMRHKRAIRKLINKIGGFKPYRDDDLEQAEYNQQSETQPAE